MKVAQLFSHYPQFKMGSLPDQDIHSLTTDSRNIAKGAVFIAVRGSAMDSHQFLPEVCSQGVRAVVVESEDNIPSSFQGAVLKVKSTRAALHELASKFYSFPSSELFCVGVTGTNGKTSLTYMIEKIFNDFGWPTGVMGTIDHHLQEHVWPSSLTTPDAITLQQRLREFIVRGAQATTFEVSSHALDQSRADGIDFDAAVFTNLTRDHLDYHQTMEQYFQAKQKLFLDLLARSKKKSVFAIVNQDDEWGRKLQIADRAKVWGYGQSPCELQFHIREQSFRNIIFDLKTPRGNTVIELPMVGLHNVFNATASMGVALAADVSVQAATQSLKEFTGVPGRLERVSNSKNIHVFVDYAHTDDALKSVLNALNHVRLQQNPSPKIITVFGCGGDRDKGKRPLMAQAAMAGSDHVILTSDNPRTEDPQQIIKDALQGVVQRNNIHIEADRKKAIAEAISMARSGDVVLIAGKGHEDYQIIGTEKFPFSDVLVAKEFLK